LNEGDLQLSEKQVFWRREAAARILQAAADLFDDPNDPNTVPDDFGSDSTGEEEEEYVSEVVADATAVTRRHNPTASMYEEDDEKYYHE
jgi:hypothetical protein